MTRAAIVVLAGGGGSRLGATDERGEAINKVYLPLAGRPVIAWSLDAAARTPGVRRLVLVVRPQDAAAVRRLLADQPGASSLEVIDGGATRHASESAALAHLAEAIQAGELDVVAVHDGARPLAGTELFAEVIEVAAETGGALPAVAAGPLLSVDGGPELAQATVDTRLVRVQTPQAFRARDLLRAFAAADHDGWQGTDTASTVERYSDLSVQVITGSATNLKITYAGDLPVAAALLASRASA
ncbi:MAG: 2-C-methyl-D-erythritol 4-phosphate cytidylyltransferase [Kineosporiaceae bacterium]|nr:2-C-methyl-D-erythritol 4-phosphate cytidylyltransferase [Kineosporiaceae bacterium]